MDNMISGLFALAVFLAFTIGLAVSIHAIPFWIIVLGVNTLLVIDYVQSVRSGFNKNGES